MVVGSIYAGWATPTEAASVGVIFACVLAAWTRTLDAADLLRVLEEKGVPGGRIYRAPEMLEDPHFNARGLFENVEINGKPLKIPAILPRLSRTPGSTRWPGVMRIAANAAAGELGGIRGSCSANDGVCARAATASSIATEATSKSGMVMSS